MKSWGVVLAVLLFSARAGAQPTVEPKQEWVWPRFHHRLAFSSGIGSGFGSAHTARGDDSVDVFAVWLVTSYDYMLASRFSVGLSPRFGVMPDTHEGLGVVDLNAIARLRFPAFRPRPSAWYVGVAAGPSKSLGFGRPERRAFTARVHPGWGYDFGVAGGLELLGRSGWGVCFEIALVHHAFTTHWTYDVKSDGSRLEEDRSYVLYETIATVGLLRGL
jgi:hypothetical protein